MSRYFKIIFSLAILMPSILSANNNRIDSYDSKDVDNYKLMQSIIDFSGKNEPLSTKDALIADNLGFTREAEIMLGAGVSMIGEVTNAYKENRPLNDRVILKGAAATAANIAFAGGGHAIDAGLGITKMIVDENDVDFTSLESLNTYSDCLKTFIVGCVQVKFGKEAAEIVSKQIDIADVNTRRIVYVLFYDEQNRLDEKEISKMNDKVYDLLIDSTSSDIEKSVVKTALNLINGKDKQLAAAASAYLADYAEAKLGPKGRIFIRDYVMFLYMTPYDSQVDFIEAQIDDLEDSVKKGSVNMGMERLQHYMDLSKARKEKDSVDNEPNPSSTQQIQTQEQTPTNQQPTTQQQSSNQQQSSKEGSIFVAYVCPNDDSESKNEQIPENVAEENATQNTPVESEENADSATGEMEILKEIETINEIIDNLDILDIATYDLDVLNNIPDIPLPLLFDIGGSNGSDKEADTNSEAIQNLINSIQDASAYTIQTTERNASGGSQGIIKTINSKTPDSDIMDISTNLNK